MHVYGRGPDTPTVPDAVFLSRITDNSPPPHDPDQILFHTTRNSKESGGFPGNPIVVNFLFRD